MVWVGRRSSRSNPLPWAGTPSTRRNYIRLLTTSSSQALKISKKGDFTGLPRLCSSIWAVSEWLLSVLTPAWSQQHQFPQIRTPTRQLHYLEASAPGTIPRGTELTGIWNEAFIDGLKIFRSQEYAVFSRGGSFHGDSFSNIAAVSGLLSSQNKAESLKIIWAVTALDTGLATQNERNKTQLPWCFIDLRNTIEKLK